MSSPSHCLEQRGAVTAVLRLPLTRFLLTFLCLGCTFLESSCRRAHPDAFPISTALEIAPQPPRVGPAVATIVLADKTRKPIAHASVDIEADMAHPGMSPTFANAHEIAPGRYQAHITFSMAGDWVLLIHVNIPDRQPVYAQIDVKAVQPQ
ncbi:MAG TPA: FixH family protein [Acidisarcina sp.]